MPSEGAGRLRRGLRGSGLHSAWKGGRAHEVCIIQLLIQRFKTGRNKARTGQGRSPRQGTCKALWRGFRLEADVYEPEGWKALERSCGVHS
jgi:hypothetical protein